MAIPVLINLAYSAGLDPYNMLRAVFPARGHVKTRRTGDRTIAHSLDIRVFDEVLYLTAVVLN